MLPHVPWRMAFLTGETRRASPASHHPVRLPAHTTPSGSQSCRIPTVPATIPHHPLLACSILCACASPRHPHQSQPPQQQLSTVEYYWSRAARRTKASTRCWMRGPAPAIVELCYRQGAYSIAHSKSLQVAPAHSQSHVLSTVDASRGRTEDDLQQKNRLAMRLPFCGFGTWASACLHCRAVQIHFWLTLRLGRGTAARDGSEWANAHQSTACF